MTRCLDCGAERTSEQCPACGLTSAAAEVMVGRRLVGRTAWFLAGAVAFVPATQIYPPLELDAILIFVGVMFFLVLGLGMWLERGTRRRAEVELPKRIYFGFVPVPWLLTALLLVNGKFDAAPPVRQTATVVGKFSMPGFLHSNRLMVTSWREGQRFERVPVERNDYDRFERGDHIVVQMREGLAGIPWVFDVSRR